MRKPQLPARRATISVVGGVNYADPSDVLVARAFQMGRDGPEQRTPMEWASADNIDFSRQILKERAGSTLYQNLASIMQANETLLGGTLFSGNVLAGTQYYEVVVGTKSIYINVYSGTNPGTWAQLQTPYATPYLHWATPARVSFVSADGHLFIMLDGNNTIQVYRTGAGLDDQMGGSWTAGAPTSTKALDGSAAGATALVVAELGFVYLGDRVHIQHAGGARSEAHYVVAKSAASGGGTLTLNAVLTNNHTTANSDDVVVENRYTQSFGGALQVITGSWPQGAYIGMSLQSRLCYSRGDVTMEYTGATNPWDRFNGGAIAADGPIVAMEAFTPRFTNMLGAVGVIHTLAPNAALQYLSGFDPSDTMKTIAGASPTWNHRSVSMTMNWIVYPTRSRRWEATDLQRVIDVGRRLRAADGVSGPFDTMNLTQAFTSGFSFYDQEKRQVQVYYPDGANTVNTNAIVLDMQLGEPTGFDSQFTDTGSYAYEFALRMLPWSLLNAGTANPWFTHMYQRVDAVVGILASGGLYKTEVNLAVDLDNAHPVFACKSPDFIMGLPGQQKKWRRMGVRTLPTNSGSVAVDIFLDRADSPTAACGWSFPQLPPTTAPLGSTPSSFILGSSLLGGGGINNGHAWIEATTEAIAFRLSDAPGNQGFLLSTIDLQYQPANVQD